MNEGDDFIIDEYSDSLFESIFGKVAGGLAMAFGVAKLLKKSKDYWKISGMKVGDSVMRKEVDPFRKVKEYEGIVVMKNNIPYVAINKGKDKVGNIVKWSPLWVKK